MKNNRTIAETWTELLIAFRKLTEGVACSLITTFLVGLMLLNIAETSYAIVFFGLHLLAAVIVFLAFFVLDWRIEEAKKKVAENRLKQDCREEKRKQFHIEMQKIRREHICH